MTANDGRRNRVSSSRGRKIHRSGAVSWLKYLVTALIVAFIVLLSYFFGGSSRPFQSVAGAVENKVDPEEMTLQSDQQLKQFYGLEGKTFDGVMFYRAESGAAQDEILLIEVSNEEQISSVREAISQRMAEKEEMQNAYLTDQTDALENAKILVRGNYVFFVVSEDADGYCETFTKSL